ncbi:hypothetical protein [Marinilabilia salmonicolor]|uniref:Uncharacterized protein n=1 Tax=Marinilabilia salmonicolor TaxID=989 RepID=A0A368URB2_9BACT|nr:hypothetical protein [Marinilabilia salmonicolor]RCW31378.1 hypothetical protein DFO77_11895 [Marinilabilia salmonicolor]
MEGVKTIKDTALKGRNRARDKFDLLEIKNRAGMAPEGETAYIGTVICDEIDKAREKTYLFRAWLVRGKPTGTNLLDMALEYFQIMKDLGYSNEVLKEELENAFGSIYRIEELEKIKGQSETNWNSLRLDLIENGFIQKADEKLFNMALNYNISLKDEEKIVWKEARRQAAVFAKRFDMEKKEFNNRFVLEKGKGPLHKNDFIGLWEDKEYKIHEILTKHGK